MDCQTALEILEVARPDSDDLSDPDLAAAAAYIGSHADCRNKFLRRQNLDRQIGRVMRDVFVPTDLKERLLVGLVDDGKQTEDAADAPAVEVETPAAGKVGLHRRTWFRLLASAAACLFAGIVVWQLVPSESEKISLFNLHDEAALAIVSDDFVFDDLDDFPNVGNVALPAGWVTILGSKQIEGPKAYTGEAQGSTAVAMYRFKFTDRRSRLVSGYVLVLPADRVTKTSKPPTALTIGERQAYPNRRFTSLSWSAGKLVYVCFVPRSGAGDAVKHLKKLLRLRLS